MVFIIEIKTKLDIASVNEYIDVISDFQMGNLSDFLPSWHQVKAKCFCLMKVDVALKKSLK